MRLAQNGATPHELLSNAFSNKRRKLRSVMELLVVAGVDIIRKAERHDTALQRSHQCVNLF